MASRKPYVQYKAFQTQRMGTTHEFPAVLVVVTAVFQKVLQKLNGLSQEFKEKENENMS